LGDLMRLGRHMGGGGALDDGVHGTSANRVVRRRGPDGKRGSVSR